VPLTVFANPLYRIVRTAAVRELDAFISAEVVQEILHRFVAIRQAVIGAQLARDALDLFAPVLSVSHAVMDRMPDLVRRYPGLAARDLVHVATCLEQGIGVIISPDRGFDEVGELRRIGPDDSDALSRYVS
jgi:predicted nucleic acid-binding protein